MIAGGGGGSRFHKIFPWIHVTKEALSHHITITQHSRLDWLYIKSTQSGRAAILHVTKGILFLVYSVSFGRHQTLPVPLLLIAPSFVCAKSFQSHSCLLHYLASTKPFQSHKMVGIMDASWARCIRKKYETDPHYASKHQFAPLKNELIS